MRRLGCAALAAGLVLAGCSSADDGVAGTTAAAGSGAVVAPGDSGEVVPQGFDTIAVRVLEPLREWCLWLAATADERARGLMGVTSLDGADGMLFDFGGVSTGEFWMYQTVLPLSIAFYDESGDFVSSADMDPCTTTNSAECARYAATGPYAYAIEVAKGDLERLGLVAGSRIEPGDACAIG